MMVAVRVGMGVHQGVTLGFCVGALVVVMLAVRVGGAGVGDGLAVAGGEVEVGGGTLVAEGAGLAVGGAGLAVGCEVGCAV